MPKDLVAHVAYDGVALAEGSMDVRDLAPALLGLGEVLTAANDELNGDRASLSVHVQSDFKSGSFHIVLGLAITAFQALQGVLGPSPLKTAKEIAEFVGLATGTTPSLLSLLRWLKGRSPDSVQLRDGQVTLTINVNGDGNTITVPQTVYNLGRNARVRAGLERAMQPLKAEGIDKFEVIENGRAIESIRREDVPAFTVPTVTTQAPPGQPRETLVQVIKPSFDSHLRWSFSDGSGGRFGAIMKDPAFIREVDAGRRFAKGDVLRVDLVSTPHVNADGKLETSHEIVRVIDVANRHHQVPLLPDPGEPER